MRDMRVGQLAFFYHSNTKPPGVVGIVEIVREAYTDHTQFDRKDPHYDPAATKVRFWKKVIVELGRIIVRVLRITEFLNYRSLEVEQ